MIRNVRLKSILSIFLFAIFICGFPAAAQDGSAQNDLEEKLPALSGAERVEALRELAYLTHNRETDTSFAYADEAVTLAETLGDQTILGSALLQRARANSALKKFDALEADASRAVTLSDKTEDGDLKCQAKVLLVIGDKHQGLLEQGLQKADEALHSCEDAANAVYYKIAFYNAANIHYELGDLDTAASMAERMSRTKGDLVGLGDPKWIPRDEAWAATTLGNIYTKQENYGAAIRALSRAEEAISGAGDTNTAVTVNYSLANVMVEAGRFEDALPILLEVHDAFITLKNRVGIIATHAQLGRVYAERGNSDRAISHADKAVALATEGEKGLGRIEREVRRARVEVLRKVGDFELALDESHQLFEDVQADFSDRRASALAQLQGELTTARQDREIERLALTGNIQALQLERQRLTIVWAVGLAALFVIGVFLVGWLALLQRRTNRRLAGTVLQRDALLREVNHRVKNNLQIILGLFQLQRQKLNTSNGVDISRAAMKDMEARLRAMNLIHQQLNSETSSDRVDIAPFLGSLGAELAKLYKGIIVLDVKSEQVTLPLDRSVPLGLIISELVSNAVEHAFATRGEKDSVTVHLRKKSDCLGELIFRDNGIGIGENSKRLIDGSSVGMKLIKSLCEQLHGEASVTDHEDGGTIWTIAFELPPPNR